MDNLKEKIKNIIEKELKANHFSILDLEKGVEFDKRKEKS